MKARNVKAMALPAVGVGAGMLASPKVSAAHPFLARYPEIAPVILLIVALALFGVKKARGFAIGLGAVALVFLVMTLWVRVTGKAVVTGAGEGYWPERRVSPEPGEIEGRLWGYM